MLLDVGLEDGNEDAAAATDDKREVALGVFKKAKRLPVSFVASEAAPRKLRIKVNTRSIISI